MRRASSAFRFQHGLQHQRSNPGGINKSALQAAWHDAGVGCQPDGVLSARLAGLVGAAQGGGWGRIGSITCMCLDALAAIEPPTQQSDLPDRQCQS
jgi:hypothetical protein